MQEHIPGRLACDIKFDIVGDQMHRQNLTPNFWLDRNTDAQTLNLEAYLYPSMAKSICRVGV